MGGKSSQQQNVNQTSNPWQPAQGALTGILGDLGNINPSLSPTMTSALDTMSKNAQGGNPWTSQLTGLTNSVAANQGAPIAQDAYSTLQKNLTPYANGSMIGNSNPAMQSWLDTIRNDATNSVNSMFAGAGRDLSGANVQALTRGIAQGEAPVLANQYNTDVNNMMGANSALFGGGQSTASLIPSLTQGAITGTQAGAQASQDAQNYGPMQQLAIEMQRQGIPLSLLSGMAGIATPIAQTGGQTTGQTTSTTQQPWYAPLASAGGLLGGLRGLWAPQSTGNT